MSRQTQTNTFNDGLNKDLNPLLTPNTVMTDCLNGTIVTYNGNEFALQNDMGNYKFNHGSLSDGFVPVGIKEHANILYIVSYNPIKNEVEIGSFPSSKTIHKSEINNYSNCTEIKLGENTWVNYTDLVKQSQLTLLSSLEEDYKLNPGDMYILENSDYLENNNSGEYNNNSLWQHTSNYIFTENNKLYNIDGFIKYSKYNENKTYELSQFNNVKWDVPGWIAVKPIVNVMNEFNCYIHELNYSVDGDSFITNATINIQSIWPTDVYKHVIDDIKNNLGYLVYSYDDGDEDFDVNDVDFDNIDECTNHIKHYNDIYSVIHSKISIKSKCKYVKIVPVLWINVNENNSAQDSKDKYIIYDQFSTIVSLESKTWDSNDIFLGSEIFNYYVSDKELIISFDLKAPPGVKMSYQLQRYLDPGLNWNENDLENGDVLYDVFSNPQEISDIVDSGQNIISIPFSYKKDGIRYKSIGNNKNLFDKEDYYEITFYIYPDNLTDNEIDSTLCKKFTKKLYVSEYVNYYHGLYDNYDDEKEFTLNESYFIESISRMMKFNSISSEDDNDIFILGDEEIKKDEICNKLESIYYEDDMVKTPYDINEDNFRNNPKIKYGTKYVFSKPEIRKPLNQRGEIGRFWREIEPTITSIKGIDENDNYVNFTEDNDTFSLEVASDIKIGFYTTSINKLYPENESNYKNMYTNGSMIEYSDDGWYKFNNNVLMWKDKERRGYSCGTWQPKNDMFFKIKNDEITIKVGSIEKTFSYEIDHWSIPDGYKDLFHHNFNYNWDWDEDDDTKVGDPAICRKTISRKMRYPGFVTFYNNRDYVTTYEINNYYYHNRRFSMDMNGLFLLDKKVNKGYDYFYSIAISGNPDENEFFLLLPKEIDFSNGDEYMINSLLTYLYMMTFIKYCVKEESTTYYKPTYNVNEEKLQKILLNKIEYNSQILYKYPRIKENNEIINIDLFYDEDSKKTTYVNNNSL